MNAPCLFLRRLGVRLEIDEAATRPTGSLRGKQIPPRICRGLAQRVSEEAGVGVPDLLGRSQFAHIAQPRQKLMWELRRLGFSYPEIGRALNRDQNTVQKGCRAHAARAGAEHATPKRGAMRP
jgi:chromosomal replication initiation ATPase DnaA